jgi:DnaK suppressor protein
MTINIENLQQRLEEKKAELERSIAGLTEAHPTPVDANEASQDSMDFEEIAVDFLETQQEQSTLVNEQALLTQVNQALKRIDLGTYGICVNCGGPIPEKRLEALPWAALDVKCQEELEQRNLRVTQTYDAQLD